MVNKFLKAKHWQLFLAIIGVMVIFQVIVMKSVFSNINSISSNEPDPRTFLNIFNFFPVIMIIMTGILYGWQWSIATGLQHKLPKGITMKIKKFKIFFFCHVIYIVLISCAIPIFVNYVTELALHNSAPNIPAIALTLVLIIPLHFFAIFCILYSMYFIAKTIKTVELQREVVFSDFVGEFFLIWFFPIGIWFIQPRINRIIQSSEDF